MDHKLKVWQVDTARGDICRDTDLGAAIAHGL